MKTLIVSRATAGFLIRGHPWVRPDRFTRGLHQLRAGEAVTLADQDGRALASALADPQGAICARVYDAQPQVPYSVEAAIARAWQRRTALHEDAATDCYRLVHGEADGLPGIRIERYADVVVVLVYAGCAEPWLEAILAAVQSRLPQSHILVRNHREDLRRSGISDRAHGPWIIDPQRQVIGRELGVRYPLRPFAGLATGLYIDQRATRERLRESASGARVLNLFAYTGAFSLSMIAAGAARAVDVDLSSVALERATEAARLNGLTSGHAVVQEDCRTFLERSRETYTHIICDPPTAAQGGEGWVARRDYPLLLRLALARLAPGGLLLACLNTVGSGGKPFPLSETVRQVAREAGIMLSEEPVFALGVDIPQMKGFPEGRPFRLVVMRRSP